MPASAPASAAELALAEPIALRLALETCQRQTIAAALGRHQGHWARAARELDLDPSNLHKLARRLGLKG